MIKRFFTLSLMIILAIGAWAQTPDFGTDDVISNTTLWTFDQFQVGDVIDDGNGSNYAGLYLKAHGSNKPNKAENKATESVFGDKTIYTVNNCKLEGGSSDDTSFAKGSVLNSRKASNYYKDCISMNIGTTGTLYITASANNKSFVVFQGNIGETLTDESNVTLYTSASNLTTTASVHTINITKPGTCWITASGAYNIYAIKFVPTTQENVTKKITMSKYGVMTFSDKHAWSFEGTGLNAYYLKSQSSGALTPLAITNTIPACTGVVLVGTPNQEYTLTLSDANSLTASNKSALDQNYTLRPVITDYTPAVCYSSKDNDTDGKSTWNNLLLKNGDDKMLLTPTDGTTIVPAGGAYYRIRKDQQSTYDNLSFNLSYTTYTLTTNVSPTETGTIVVTNNGTETTGTTFLQNTDLVLTATPATNYALDYWSTDGTNENQLTAESDGTLNLSMTENKTVYAVFKASETITPPSASFEDNVITMTAGSSAYTENDFTATTYFYTGNETLTAENATTLGTALTSSNNTIALTAVNNSITVQMITVGYVEKSAVISETFNYVAPIYGEYDFQTWANDNISGDVAASQNESGNIVASDKTMVLNNSLTITGDFKMRKNNATSTGIHRFAGTGTLTIKNLKAGDWFYVNCTSSQATGAVLTFSNNNAYPLDEANAGVNGQVLVSGTIYVVKEDGDLPFVFGDANAQSYIHKIEIGNTEKVPAPIINYDSSTKKVTITKYNSTKNNVPTVYYAIDENEMAVFTSDHIDITVPVTIKAQSKIDEMLYSTIVSKSVSGYTISAPTISATESGEVTITPGERSDTNEAITTYYTLDNTDPKTNEDKLTYSAPFTIDKTAIVRAYSLYNNYQTVVSDEAEALKVRIGTFTAEENVYDFAAAAGDFQELSYSSTVVTPKFKYYYKDDTDANKAVEGNFYKIQNTDYMTKEGNSSNVYWREHAGYLTQTGGITSGTGQKYFTIDGLSEGMRVIVDFKNGKLKYATGVGEGEATFNGSTLNRNTEIATGSTVTITSGSYLVLNVDANTVIQKITVLPPAPTFTLTVAIEETGKGSVTDKNGDPLNESYEEGSAVELKATATAEGYQFFGWYNGETRLSLKNPYSVTLNDNTTIKAMFKQPATTATAETAEKIWTFDDFTANTELSGTQVYEYDNLYISGHNISGSNPAKVMAGNSTTDTGMGEVTNYLYFAGGNNNAMSNKAVTDYVTDRAAFKAGAPGFVSVYTSSSSDTRKTAIVINGDTKQNAYVDLTLGSASKDVTEANANVFVGLTGAGNLYAIKFTPETVTAPAVSVDASHVGTITAGTSNLTDDANKDIKTYYTIDGTDPTAESMLYEGVIMASGSNITVKTFSVNTVTGTASDVTTETGLTLSLPSKTFNATVGTTGAGTVTWKKAGTDEAQADSYEQGTSIEVTATATGNYMFLNWTKGGEIVAKTATYTFTLMEKTELVANFKDMGNTVPVILTAGQSNTDGRIRPNETAFPYTLDHTMLSYCNGVNYTTEGEFIAYGTTPRSDSGDYWGYDAVVYDKIQTELGGSQDFYVIKQSKGNTGISPASGGMGMFWSANPVWLTYNTSANRGGKSLLKALCDQIDASLDNLPSGKTADIKFLMWHQGECDKNQSGAYETQLKAMINYVRNHMVAKTGNGKYSQLPIILGGIIPVPSDAKGCEYNVDVENAKKAIAEADANVYYVDVADLGTNYADYLRTDNVHFNAAGATEFGTRVWKVITDNNLLAGLTDGTGSTTPVSDILKQTDPVAGGSNWNFNEQTEGEYTTLTDFNGLYLHSGSSNKMKINAAETEVTYADNTTVSTTKYLQVSPAGDRSKFMTYGLTAGDVVDMDRAIGVNTSEAGTFYAIVAPDTEPSEAQAGRNMYLVFGGEKVDTKNVRTVWDDNTTHTTTLKYKADKAGTFFLTSDHAFRLYAAKFVKAGEEAGPYVITTNAVGGTVTLTAPAGKTLEFEFDKGEEVTLQATPDEGFNFVEWKDDKNQTLGTETILTFTIAADMNITAVFKAQNSAPVVYNFSEAFEKETISFEETAIKIYENSGEKDQLRSDYYKITNKTSEELPIDGRISWRIPNGKTAPALVNGGLKSNSYAFAIHDLVEGDKVTVLYTGGTIKSYVATVCDAITIDGTEVASGNEIPSGSVMTISAVNATNNYITLFADSKTVISAIYINKATPKTLAKPTMELNRVEGETSVYTATYDEEATFHYVLESVGEEVTIDKAPSCEVVIAKSDNIKAWTTYEKLTSDILEMVVYAPTPAPSTEGEFNFGEAAEELPADLTVTLDASQKVTMEDETLYKPSALTAASFGERFAFTETTENNKIRIRTNGNLTIAKGKDVHMALMGLKAGEVLIMEFTGAIDFAKETDLTTQDTEVQTSRRSIAANTALISGEPYILTKDEDLLLHMDLHSSAVNITKIYITTVPSPSEAMAVDFATAYEDYEQLELGQEVGVYYYGKGSAQTFQYLTNASEDLPIEGKISTEAGKGEITAEGIKASKRRIAIHDLAVGDEIIISFYGGELSYVGHATRGDRVSVDGTTLVANDVLTTGAVIKVEKLDYLNNNVVFYLDNTCTISGIFINKAEVEKVFAPTLAEAKDKNTVTITAGRSSMGRKVVTCYTTDGTEPSALNGTSAPYDSFEVEVQDNNGIFVVKAVSYTDDGSSSAVASITIYVDGIPTDIQRIKAEFGEDAVIYDLTGHRVNTPKKGRVYVINGKKMFFK